MDTLARVGQHSACVLHGPNCLGNGIVGWKTHYTNILPHQATASHVPFGKPLYLPESACCIYKTVREEGH